MNFRQRHRRALPARWFRKYILKEEILSSEQEYFRELTDGLGRTYLEVGGTPGEFGWLAYNEELLKDLIGVQRGSHKIYPVAKELSPVVRVDRASPLMYPLWTKKVLYPELESAGPDEYDLEADVERWFYSDQGCSIVFLKDLYRQIEARGLLPGFLGLRDAVAIQQRGLEFFRKYFQGKAVYFWKSAITNRRGLTLVPYLEEEKDDVLLRWRGLYNAMRCFYEDHHMALRFKHPSSVSSSSAPIKA